VDDVGRVVPDVLGDGVHQREPAGRQVHGAHKRTGGMPAREADGAPVLHHDRLAVRVGPDEHVRAGRRRAAATVIAAATEEVLHPREQPGRRPRLRRSESRIIGACRVVGGPSEIHPGAADLPCMGLGYMWVDS
jgi:hypothetical protein